MVAEQETGKANRKRFQALFAGDPNFYGCFEPGEPVAKGDKQKGKTWTEKSPHKDMNWRRHLAGEMGLGIVPILKDSTCVYGGIDIDDYNIDVPKLCKELQLRRLPLMPMLSKSGGVHLYIFLKNPHKAIKVRALLINIASALGYPGVEIFPKQVKKGAVGNWLNLPYFGDSRQALDSDGEPMPIEAFLDLAESCLTDLNHEQPFTDGPPCLERLAPFIVDGERNAAMFAMGIYCKKKYPDTWDDELEKLNELMEPELETKELLSLIKSLREKEYKYKCGEPPIKAACNRDLCVKRTHGIIDRKLVFMPSAFYPYRRAAADISERLAATGKFFNRGGPVLVEENKIRMVNDHRLKSVVETIGNVQVHTSTVKTKPSLPSLEAMRTIRSSLDFKLPELKAVTSIPLLSESGEIISGFHDGVLSGVLHFPTIDLKQAVMDLKLLLRDYDFVDAGHRARALAAFITPLLRMSGLIEGHVPIDVSDADKSQAGKTLRTEIIYRIYRETPEKIILKDSKGGVGGMEESLSHALVKSRGFVRFDNVRGKLESQFFESIVTDFGRVSVRCFGVPQAEVDVSRLTFHLTSNGLHLSEDLANRCSIVRIMKRPDDYKYYDWAEGGILQHIEANSNHYLGCVFAVARHWVTSGRPRHKSKTLHDFREWAESMEWIMRNVFNETQLLADHREVQKGVAEPVKIWLRQMFEAIMENHKENVALSASALLEIATNSDLPVPGDKQTAQGIGVLLKKEFEAGDVLHLGGFNFERDVWHDTAKGRDVKRYTLERSGIEEQF